MIKFGTEGWREVISKELTFENIAKVSQSIADYLKSSNKSTPVNTQKIVIGYDNRFLSERFAGCSAAIFKKNGFNTVLSATSVITPNICQAVKSMITASHNPPKFNGLKIKAHYGGPAPEWFNKEIENNIPEKTVEYATSSEGVATSELIGPYIDYINKLIDFDKIHKIKQNIVFDCMHGPSYRYIDQLFGKNNKKIVRLRDKRDILFSGFNPEPIEKYMGVTKTAVIKHRAAVGIATDGDGDRVGIVADGGSYLAPHTVFPLLLYYQAKYKNLKPKVAQTISLGYLSERIAKQYNLDFEETPVGFKYITEKILKEKNVFGGEESCGYSMPGGLPDRDGILSGLTVLEMIGSAGKKLSSLVNDLQKEFGESSFMRYDFHLPEIIYDKEIFTKKVTGFISGKIYGKIVRQIKTFDGIKIVLEDDSWLLMRPSGTEPLLRVYSETPSRKTTSQLIEYGKKIVNSYFKNK